MPGVGTLRWTPSTVVKDGPRLTLVLWVPGSLATGAGISTLILEVRPSLGKCGRRLDLGTLMVRAGPPWVEGRAFSLLVLDLDIPGIWISGVRGALVVLGVWEPPVRRGQFDLGAPGMTIKVLRMRAQPLCRCCSVCRPAW